MANYGVKTQYVSVRSTS